ncbi:DUF6262 family protein [Protaetiibacter sp. SSC-01]|uniref:DUF6262 family protein n=1 Tax=Protaetiibacter sp. SSC-01 TaxID=2759943 RepID=UPI001CA4549D|nr:DUF6262 family protein [Protaetiibacter sp. SSC-01]
MPEHLTDAARARSDRSLTAVRAAVRRLDKQRKAISVSSVAAEAGVSRNFIYTTPEARDLVLGARTEFAERRPQSLPKSKAGGSTDASLRTRLAAALQEIRSLTDALEAERAKNATLIAEVVALQNPVLPPNVLPIRERRF